MTKNLYSKEVSKQFYEERFSKGYMDDWDKNKKQRIFEILRELPLPEKGELLDFGCGNGVFTEVLKHALPQWKIYGCDISEVAISHAKKRFLDGEFFISDNDNPYLVNKKFDFIFSHHVLEHVFDIRKTLIEINSFLKPNGNMLLILPCGNQGSLEFNVANLRTDGINKEMENRFFYEDVGHVRRLTTSQITALLNEHNIKLAKAYYSNQYSGAIKWITQSSPKFILQFADPFYAKDEQAKEKLNRLRLKLLFLNLLQLPTILFHKIKNKRSKTFKDYVIFLFDIIPFILSYPFYAIIDKRSEEEWKKYKMQSNGSEMFVFFKKGSLKF